jgi:ribosomal RNA-processing protein 9
VWRQGRLFPQASGAGDGLIRLWQVEEGKSGAQGLSSLGGLPARGFANALHIAKSGRFVLAGMGQEPRLGRWAHDKSAKNGLLLHMLELAEHSPRESSAEE